METVEEQILLLKKQARERGLEGKIKGIARKLGTRTGKKHGCYWDYSHFTGSLVKGRPTLQINFDDYHNGNIFVAYLGKKVFGTQLGTINCYRPDIEGTEEIPGWEKIIEELYEEHVVPHLEEIKKKGEAERRQRLAHDWGIKIQ